MAIYIFASVDGNNYESEGDTPNQALINLYKNSKDKNSLWKIRDNMCNRHAVANLGFNKINDSSFSDPVWKLKNSV